MARKTGASPEDGSSPRGPAGLFDSELAATIRQQAQQIWLAGLGAFAKAQEEGSKMFDHLAKEGADMQRRAQGATEGKFGDMGSRVGSFAEEMQARAGQQWEKVEAAFEDRTLKTLRRLGVPTRQDLDALAARIDALAVMLAQRGAGDGAASEPAASRPRPAARRAARSTPSRAGAPSARKSGSAAAKKVPKRGSGSREGGSGR